MPFELTAHDPYTERLPDGAEKKWNAGEDVSDPDAVARLFDNPFFVKRWVDDVAAKPSATVAADQPKAAPVPASITKAAPAFSPQASAAPTTA